MMFPRRFWISSLLLASALNSGCVAPLLVVGGVAAGGVMVNADRRSAGTQLEDESIELKASGRVRTFMNGRSYHLNVTSFNRVVLITGEGRVDSQSLQGKVISGLLRRTVRRGIPLLVIAGAIDQSAAAAYEKGVTAMFSTDRRALGYPEVLADCEEDYRATLEDVLRFARALEK